MTTETDIRAITARIVSSYLSYNRLKAPELPGLILTVHEGLVSALAPPRPAVFRVPARAKIQALIQRQTARSPAEIRNSKSADWLISFENGRPYKCLKLHLRARQMSPDQYRQKWGLPKDYPMVAANYSAKRAAMMRTASRGKRRGREDADTSATTKRRAESYVGVAGAGR